MLHDRLGWRVTHVGQEAHCFDLGTQPLFLGAWIATGVASLGAMQMMVLPFALPEGERWVGIVAPGALLLVAGTVARLLFVSYRKRLGRTPSPTVVLDLATGDVRDARGQTVANFLTDRLERRRNLTYRTIVFVGYLVVRGPKGPVRLAQGDSGDLDALERELRALCGKPWPPHVT